MISMLRNWPGTKHLAAGLLFLGIGFSGVAAGAAPASPRILSLNQALMLTLANKQTIRSARAAIASARAQKLGAVAAYLPSLSLTNQAQYYKPLGGASTTLVAGTVVPSQQAFYSNVISTDFNLNLFDSGKDSANYRAALATLHSADANLLATTNTSFNRVMADYEAFAKDRATIAVQQQTITLQQDISSKQAARFQHRMSSRIDWNQARQQVFQAETQLSLDRQQATKDWKQLLRDMDTSGAAEDWRVDTDLSVQPPRPSASVFNIHQDPEVKAADASVEAARAQVQVAKAGYGPTVSVSAQCNWLGTDSASIGDAYASTNGRGYSVGLVFTMPLLPFFNTEAAVDSARANVQSALGNYQKSLTNVGSRVQSTRRLFREADKSVQLAARSARLAANNVELVKALFHAHQASRMDVDQVQLAQLETDLSVKTARMDRWLAAWRLYRAVDPERFATELLTRTRSAPDPAKAGSR